MIQKIKDFIDDYQLLKPNCKIIVGLSGGADSVALLHILHKLDYACISAHCNFHLRGEESARDEQFAAEIAASLELPFIKQDFDTKKMAKERKISIEMAARELRYQWFSKLKDDEQADAIAVAHHRDDNIETLLLNLIRGTGIKGLTGIQPKRGSLVRPMLCVYKTEILQYIQTENLPFVSDSSNQQNDPVRNKIRLQIIPLLETINPSVREAIIQTMENMNEAFKIYETEIDKAIQVVYNQEKKSISIPILKQFSSPESMLFELLKVYGFGKEVIQDIYSSMNSQSGKTFYAPEYYLVKDRDQFLISTFPGEKEKEYFIQAGDTSLEFPFKMSISIQKNEANAEIEKSVHVACLDYDKLQFPLKLRRWIIGDKFKPYGMKNFKKLSDFFANRKFSKIQKEKTWILTSGKQIVWVVNHRIDDRFKVNENTKNRFILKLL